MSKNWRPPALTLMALAVASCVSTPDTPNVYVVANQRTYERPYDNVWRHLMGFFAEGRLQIKTVEKASGIVYAENLTYREDAFADCGDPGRAEDVVGGSAALNVFVEPPRQGTTTTRVIVNTKFTQRREDHDLSRTTVDCNSTGVLENALLDHLESTEAAPPPPPPPPPGDVPEQGDADPQHNLGPKRQDGEGVPQDYSEAQAWFRKAAEQGDAIAQFSLGVMYTKGLGLPQDHTRAMRWYRRAAEQGHSRAQNNLGAIYDIGRGVMQDYVQAHLWFSLAATTGDERATKNRFELTKRMSLAQIAEAQRLAREWKPKKDIAAAR